MGILERFDEGLKQDDGGLAQAADDFKYTLSAALHLLGELNKGHLERSAWQSHIETQIQNLVMNLSLGDLEGTLVEWVEYREELVKLIKLLMKEEGIILILRCVESIRKLDQYFGFVPGENDFFEQKK